MPDCGVHYLWFAFVCFLIRSHPPFQTPQSSKVFEPIFLQFEILGESVGAEIFCNPCVYTPSTQNFVENSKMGEKRRKIFDTRPDLRVGPWLMGA